MARSNDSFYADASLYDILHTAGTAEEVDGLERIAQRFAGAEALAARAVWLEPACGSGRYLRVIASRGRRCVGFDLEPAMVAYARERIASLGVSHRASVLAAGMENFVDHMARGVVGRVSFAFNLINTVRHLMSDAAMHRHLREVARSLAPGGIYALGVGTHVPEFDQPSEDVWTGTRGRVRVTQTVQYLPPPEFGPRVERVVSHVVRSTPAGDRHIDSVYDLRTYTLAQWNRLIGASAMQIVGVVDDEGQDMAAPEAGYAVYVLRPRRQVAR